MAGLTLSFASLFPDLHRFTTTAQASKFASGWKSAECTPNLLLTSMPVRQIIHEGLKSVGYVKDNDGRSVLHCIYESSLGGSKRVALSKIVHSHQGCQDVPRLLDGWSTRHGHYHIIKTIHVFGPNIYELHLSCQSETSSAGLQPPQELPGQGQNNNGRLHP